MKLRAPGDINKLRFIRFLVCGKNDKSEAIVNYLSILGGGKTEELKKEAVEKLRHQMEEDYSKGYKRAIELVKDGKISLQEVENLVAMEQPFHDEFVEKSKAFVEGFIDALRC